MQVTRARVFDDFGGAALGNWGRRAVYVTVYATILAEPIIFHLTSMEALQQIFYGAGLTQKFAALLVTAIMVPLAQVSHACHHSSSTDACAIHLCNCTRSMRPWQKQVCRHAPPWYVGH